MISGQPNVLPNYKFNFAYTFFSNLLNVFLKQIYYLNLFYQNIQSEANELHSKFTLDIHIATNSFALLLGSDLQTMQHMTA